MDVYFVLICTTKKLNAIVKNKITEKFRISLKTYEVNIIGNINRKTIDNTKNGIPKPIIT